MSSTLSLEGIDRALDNLNYRDTKSLKYRLVAAIRRYYASGHPIDQLTHINSDELIKQLWHVNEATGALKSKRKNLNSIVSTVNADLKRLYQAHKNPEGIIIGPHYTFVMSNEAKDEFLRSIASAIDIGSDHALDRISDVLGMIGGALTDVDSEVLIQNRDGIANIKRTLNNLSRILKIDEVQLAAVAEHLSDTEASAELPPTSDVNDTDEHAHLSREKHADRTKIGQHSDESSQKDLTVKRSSHRPESIDTAEIAEDLIDGQKANDKPLSQTVAGSSKKNNQIDTNGHPELTHADGDLRKDPNASDDIVTGLIEAEESDTSAANSELAVGSDPLAEIDDDEIERLASVIEEDDLVIEATEIESDDAEEVEFIVDASEPGTEFEIADDQLAEIDEKELEEMAAGIKDETDSVDESSDDSAENEIVEVLTNVVDLDEEPLALDDADSMADIEDGENEDVIEMDPDEYELMDHDAVDTGEPLEPLIKIGQDADEAGTPQKVPENGDDQLGLPREPFSDVTGLNAYGDDESPRLLAEQFDGYLGAMERYYNQYLRIDAKQVAVGCKSPQQDELPEKVVTLPDFFIGKFPVTNALFEVFVERTGYVTTAEKKGHGFVYRGRLQKIVDPHTGQPCSIWNAASESAKVQGACWYQPAGEGSSLHKKRHHPVVQVSLKDAEAFAAWTGKRIPTEIEWEAASRTQEANLYPWGSLWKDDACNIEDNAVADTTPVDNFPEAKNFYGLFDTLGNVLEWTTDQSDFHQLPSNDAGLYITRGGCWLSNRDITLCSRYCVEADHSSNIIGFRCVAD